MRFFRFYPVIVLPLRVEFCPKPEMRAPPILISDCWAKTGEAQCALSPSPPGKAVKIVTICPRPPAETGKIGHAVTRLPLSRDLNWATNRHPVQVKGFARKRTSESDDPCDLEALSRLVDKAVAAKTKFEENSKVNMPTLPRIRSHKSMIQNNKTWFSRAPRIFAHLPKNQRS